MERDYEVAMSVPAWASVNDGPQESIDAVLVYRSCDPYAVGLRLWHVCWWFDRTLLATGMDCRCGLGDVTVEPVSITTVLVHLRSPEGHGTVSLPRPVCRRFLARIAALVPPGSERQHIDWDQVVQQLTGGAA